MPLIKIKTSGSTPDINIAQELLKILSSKLSQHLGEPETYVMTSFELNTMMTFGETFEPVCYVEIKSIGSMNTIAILFHCQVLWYRLPACDGQDAHPTIV